MPITICPSCNESREVTKDRGTRCRACCNRERASNRRDSNGMYPHECVECGTVWSTKTDTLAKRCRPCSSKVFSSSTRKKPDEYVKYSYTCTSCKETFATKYNPIKKKTSLCGDCSRREIGKANKLPANKITGKIVKVVKARHYRVCRECNDVKEVTSKASARVTICKPCSNALKRKAGKHKKTKKVNLEAIERERIKNRQHHIRVAEVEKVKRVETTQEDMDRMIAEYCQNNEVMHYDCKDTYGMADQVIYIGD